MLGKTPLETGNAGKKQPQCVAHHGAVHNHWAHIAPTQGKGADRILREIGIDRDFPVCRDVEQTWGR